MENAVINSNERVEKTVKTIIMVLSGHAAFIIYKNINYLYFLFSWGGFQSSFSEVVFIFFLISLPISLIFFHYKKKIGWILLCTFLSFNLTSNIIEIIPFFTKNAQEVNTYFEATSTNDGFGYLLSIILLSTILFFISKLNIRNLYNVSLKTALITILSSSLFTSLTYFYYENY
jgi:hypothetical protein